MPVSVFSDLFGIQTGSSMRKLFYVLIPGGNISLFSGKKYSDDNG